MLRDAAPLRIPTRAAATQPRRNDDARSLS